MNPCFLPKPVLLNLTLSLSLTDLENLCKTNKDCYNKICNNDGFWKLRLIHENRPIDENSNTSFKYQYYKDLSILEISKDDNFMYTQRGVLSVTVLENYITFITINRDLYKFESAPFYITDNVKDVSCSSKRLMILKLDNVAYVWENNNFIKMAENVFSVHCGEKYLGYITLDYTLYLNNLVFQNVVQVVSFYDSVAFLKEGHVWSNYYDSFSVVARNVLKLVDPFNFIVKDGIVRFDRVLKKYGLDLTNVVKIESIQNDKLFYITDSNLLYFLYYNKYKDVFETKFSMANVLDYSCFENQEAIIIDNL